MLYHPSESVFANVWNKSFFFQPLKLPYSFNIVDNVRQNWNNFGHGINFGFWGKIFKSGNDGVFLFGGVGATFNFASFEMLWTICYIDFIVLFAAFPSFLFWSCSCALLDVLVLLCAYVRHGTGKSFFNIDNNIEVISPIISPILFSSFSIFFFCLFVVLLDCKWFVLVVKQSCNIESCHHDNVILLCMLILSSSFVVCSFFLYSCLFRQGFLFLFFPLNFLFPFVPIFFIVIVKIFLSLSASSFFFTSSSLCYFFCWYYSILSEIL